MKKKPAKNYKTTVAGCVAAAATVIGQQSPEYREIAQAVAALALVLLGKFAADAK